MKRLFVVVIVGLTIVSLSLKADFAAEQSAPQKLFELGKGSYRWWGIKVYDARLFVDETFDGNYFSSRPVILEIQYDIDIDKDDLVETTREEWSELSISSTEQCRDREAWLIRLSQLWPDLKQGDKLRHEITATGESLFYFNDQLLGKVEDINFGPCFLSIWLAPDTSAPGLRKKLLALQSANRR